MENSEYKQLNDYLDSYFDLRVTSKIQAEIKSRDETISKLRSELANLQDCMKLANAALSDLAKSAANRKTHLSTSISVIIATKNRFDFLLSALKSCVWQTSTPSEVIIVNDGHDFTDIEIGKISLIFEGICPFVIIKNKFLRAAGARKTGMEAAASQVLTYLDDDNLMWPTWLESVDQNFRMGQDQLVYGAQLRKDWHNYILAESFYSHKRLCHSNFIDAGSIAHDANFGLWDDGLSNLREDDWDFVLSIASQQSSEIRYLPQISSVYFSDVQGRISTLLPSSREYLVKRYQAFFDQNSA